MKATFLTLPPDSAIDPSKPHLILVGLPGAGKSTVGQEAATQLGRPFLDFDREIERREGAAVAAIFGEKGEPYFREKERALTTELAALGGMVLSPGGGWITDQDGVALLRPRARIIYLKVRPELALQRLGPERATRPLLTRPDPLGELKRLLKERESHYQSADLAIETDVLTVQQVTEQVIALARGSGRG
jgi:shikimate kinase